MSGNTHLQDPITCTQPVHLIVTIDVPYYPTIKIMFPQPVPAGVHPLQSVQEYDQILIAYTVRIAHLTRDCPMSYDRLTYVHDMSTSVNKDLI